MNSLLSIGASGVQAAQASLDRSANRVARWGTADARAAPVDLAAEAVSQIQARQQFAANLQTLRTADTLLGTLVDAFA